MPLLDYGIAAYRGEAPGGFAKFFAFSVVSSPSSCVQLLGRGENSISASVPSVLYVGQSFNTGFSLGEVAADEFQEHCLLRPLPAGLQIAQVCTMFFYISTYKKVFTILHIRIIIIYQKFSFF